MNYLDTLFMLFRWAREGWEVHPLFDSNDFDGWV
jgi:hypothetical protein